MKTVFGILCLALLAGEIRAKSINAWRSKRSAEESDTEKVTKLNDPDGCVEKCEDSYGGPPNEPGYDNPFVQLCHENKYDRECWGKCAASDTKTLLLEQAAPMATVCDSPRSPVDLAKAADCVYDQMADIIPKCMSDCKASEDMWMIVPDVFPDFNGDDIKEESQNAVVAIYQTDSAVVTKNLTELCPQAECMLKCQQTPIKTKCGEDVAKDYVNSYAQWVKSLPKTYQKLGVIKSDVDACEKISV